MSIRNPSARVSNAIAAFTSLRWFSCDSLFILDCLEGALNYEEAAAYKLPPSHLQAFDSLLDSNLVRTCAVGQKCQNYNPN